jgi:hypothetical protein
MGERSRRRVRDLVTQLAFEGLSENEIGRARISMMARSDLLHARAGYRSARPTTVLKIQLTTRGRSIQMGQQRTCEHPRYWKVGRLRALLEPAEKRNWLSCCLANSIAIIVVYFAATRPLYLSPSP